MKSIERDRSQIYENTISDRDSRRDEKHASFKSEYSSLRKKDRVNTQDSYDD